MKIKVIYTVELLQSWWAGISLTDAQSLQAADFSKKYKLAQENFHH